MELVVKIKKLHPDAVIPKYAKVGDVGMDITAISQTSDEYGNIVYGSGLAFEIPQGYFMMLVPRSSNFKTDLMLTNHCGIADSGYRGEIMFKYRDLTKYMEPNWGKNEKHQPVYKIGERIGQLIILPYPQIKFEEVYELSDSERGSSGYGSTGK